jgi:hypothetical protein
MMRTMLYEAAQSMMHSTKWSWLKAWAMQIARRRGMKKAIVVLARRLAVILHRIWVDGTEKQRWNCWVISPVRRPTHSRTNKARRSGADQVNAKSTAATSTPNRRGFSCQQTRIVANAINGSRRPYSITSSARPSSIAGISRPSALAVLRLITRSNFSGRCIGKSFGLAPCRIFPT